jgi:hypothetical protein
MNENQTWKFYKDMNKIWEDYNPPLTLCKGEDGKIISKKEEILKRWQEYFQSLLKTPESELSTDNTMQICNDSEETIEPPPI